MVKKEPVGTEGGKKEKKREPADKDGSVRKS
jgi:hypothetical protein